MPHSLCFVATLAFTACSTTPTSNNAVFDVLIRGGQIYDGSGNSPRAADIGIQGDRIVKVAAPGSLSNESARSVVDASGLAVAPGFINMLSWAVDDLIADGRSQGDIRQGVTTEYLRRG